MPGTLGTDATTKVTRTMRESINMSFVAKKVFAVGEPVQLHTDGEVDSLSVPTRSIGIVFTPNKAIGEKVTVLTRFLATSIAKASGTVNVGTLIKIDATASQTNGVPTYVAAASTNVANAIAITGGADGASIEVGFLYGPVVAP